MAQTQRKRINKQAPTPKKCHYCTEQKAPHFSDVSVLQRYTTERGKMYGRSRSGFCARHQKMFMQAIKHARYLALMPYIIRE